MTRNGRLFYLATACLLLAGSAVFLWGGSQHPSTSTSLGPLGTDTYMLHFAEHIAAHPSWIKIHTAILLGPVLWMLGVAGLWVALNPGQESPLGSLGRTAFASGGTLWAVAFAFDGFVAPGNATAVVAADPGNVAFYINQLRSTQNVVIRVGLISWTLIGIGLAVLSLSVLSTPILRGPIRTVLGVTGVVLGLWPAAAWALRIFYPGPFVSPLWMPTALATGLWFFILGISLLPGLRLSPEPVPAG